MNDCLPCALEHTEPECVVYRDDDWACEVATGYEIPGWYILRIRRHTEGWASLAHDEATAFGLVSQRVAQAIQVATGAPRVYFMSFGENYPHFHFLVIARPNDLAPQFEGVGILSLRSKRLDKKGALATATEVRTALHRNSSAESRLLEPPSPGAIHDRSCDDQTCDSTAIACAAIHLTNAHPRDQETVTRARGGPTRPDRARGTSTPPDDLALQDRARPLSLRTGGPDPADCRAVLDVAC